MPLDDTARSVEAIRSAFPCSVELPAGAGKTYLIAELSAALAAEGKRALLLTHTNAGVDALRRRLQCRQVPGAQISVRTIDGWCFDLISHFPFLAGIVVDPDPNWDKSRDYLAAAERAVRSPAVRRMLAVSYDFLVVDEYQDCVVEQHALIKAMSESFRTVIFGDPLQGLFTFSDNELPDWHNEVLNAFPRVEIEAVPRRWEKTNPGLGRWLVEVRESLKRGESINLSGAPVTWVANETRQARVDACFSQPTGNGSVVALGQFRHDIADVAKGLRGSYGVMEELEGSFMLSFADIVDAGDAATIAEATVTFATNCLVGVAKAIDSRKRKRLAQGKSVATRDSDLSAQYEVVNDLLEDPSPVNVRRALVALRAAPRTALYCREAWHTTVSALQQAALDPDLTVRQAIVRSRNHSRLVGRVPEKRVISRPLLVKGLEYDHVLILNADVYNAAELYVALTRGRKTTTVISRSETITPEL